MLDQEALEIAYGRLSAESVEWQRSFNAKLQRVQNEFCIKGMGTSSALIEAVADICAQEVETRANRVWEVLRGLLQGAKGPHSDEDVKKLYSDFDRLYITYCYTSALARQTTRQLKFSSNMRHEKVGIPAKPCGARATAKIHRGSHAVGLNKSRWLQVCAGLSRRQMETLCRVSGLGSNTWSIGMLRQTQSSRFGSAVSRLSKRHGKQSM
jgi:hypothetical protein